MAIWFVFTLDHCLSICSIIPPIFSVCCKITVGTIARASVIPKMKPLVGEGLLVSEGEFWLHQRRLIQPSFHRERIAELMTPMRETIGAMLTRWQVLAESGEPLDMAVEMVRLTRAIISRVLFGIDMTENGNELVRALDLAAHLADDFTIRLTRNPLAILGALGFLPARTPTPVSEAIRELDRVLYQAIAERRGAGSRGDLLSMLLEIRDEKSGEGMTDRQVRDEALTIFLAGNETAAIALTWLWDLLARNPEAERRLGVEVDEVLGGRTPNLADLTRLKYTQMVVSEAMRLYPPGWMIARTAIESDEMGGWEIPAGCSDCAQPVCNPSPPGFLEKTPMPLTPSGSLEPTERPRYAYFPFGGGASPMYW